MRRQSILEAFEMQMEDKIWTLLAELSLGRPPSPKKSQQGESSDRKDEFQERGGSMTDPYYPRMRIDFPMGRRIPARKGGSRPWLSHLYGWLATAWPLARGQPVIAKAPCKGATGSRLRLAHRDGSHRRAWPLAVRCPQERPAYKGLPLAGAAALVAGVTANGQGQPSPAQGWRRRPNEGE
ncbi:hypothetical protein BHE74_00042246 [Ensete ventricosum]|nr:hypothetical protein BHE74_00042246 [Ensete ventricosum]